MVPCSCPRGHRRANIKLSHLRGRQIPKLGKEELASIETWSFSLNILNSQNKVYPCQFKSENSRTRLFCVFIIHWSNFASFSPSNGLFVTTKYRNVLMSLFLVQNTKTRIPVACWINQLPRPRQNVNFNVRNTLFVSIKNPREESQTSVSHFLIISVWMTFEPYLSKQNQIEI